MDSSRSSTVFGSRFFQSFRAEKFTPDGKNMGLLDKLWDDTVAGPTPDTGLGRLRKFPPFSIRTDFSKDGSAEGYNGMRISGENSPAAVEETITPRVTRSIMIRRPDGSPRGTPPESPAGSTPPISPFRGSPVGTNWNRFRRKSMSDAYERSRGNGGPSSTTSPTTPGKSSASAAENEGSGSSTVHCSPFEM